MNPVEIIVGLDIGTTKIVCLIAEKNEQGKLTILARGESKSEGLRRGVVVNIESTSSAIVQAVEQAEKLSGVTVEDVYVGIAGDHISSKASSGMVTISGADKIVSRDDVKRVIDAAKTISVPSDREILHIIPLEYTIDGQEGILEPVGMAGMRLSAEIHIVTAAKSAMQNLRNSVNKAGLKVREFVLEPLASSYAILQQDERKLGVCLVDIGGGTTDLAMYYDDSLRYTAVVPIGGTNVTNDLSIGLRTTQENAEQIKVNYGIAHTELVEDDETAIEVPGVGGRSAASINKRFIAQIIQPRMEELFEMVYTEMKRTDYYELMSAGLVLTGGAATLSGCAELASQKVGLPVKIGVPTGVEGLIDAVDSPKYATAVGLVKYGETKLSTASKVDMFDFPFMKSKNMGSVVDRFKNWLDNIL
jgi:cell division protein FtsA